MHILTVAEVRAADVRTTSEFGVPGQLLMELAGLHGAKHAWRKAARAEGPRIVVFAGGGNNGGDGYVAARHLRRWGARVRLYAIGRPPGEDTDAGRAREMARRAGVDVVAWDEAAERRADLHVAAADVVLDALLGTGAKGPPRQPAAAAIDVINRGGRPVVSVDVPSGVDADTGAAPGPAVRASETVTFGALKPGLVLGAGRELAGAVTVADIGWPPEVQEGASITWVTADGVQKKAPRRPPGGHKGDFGRVLVVAGSRGMAGAGALAVRGAQRVGAGLVTLAAPAGLHDVYAASVPEALTAPLPEDGAGALASAASASLAPAVAAADVVAAGPGLGTGSGAAAVVKKLLESALVPVVLDADALNVAAARPELLDGPRAATALVLTPHPGEMSRLWRRPVPDVVADPIGIARKAADRWRAVVVLKGAPTVVAAPDGHVYVNSTGSDALASGGAGDVLTGAVAGLVGQGASALDAALLAVYVHGLAGERAGVGAVAAEVADGLSAALQDVARGQLAEGGPARLRPPARLFD